jgi:DNA processing protein
MSNHSTDDELYAWVRLACDESLGTAQALKVAHAFGGPRHLFAQPLSALRNFAPEALADHIAAAPSATVRRRIDQALAWSLQPGCALLHPAHPDYPATLLQAPGYPALLFAQGNLACLRREALAIVGSRNATADGEDNARAFARRLAQQGLCIVSGLALGIDAAAHRGALDAGSEGAGTIAVLGTGADIVYPTSNTALAARILGQEGLIITELPLGSPPRSVNFPRRNRIVAGLARGVLVVEAAQRSGSLITARLAADMGREVFAIPGSIHSPLSRGPHTLIQQGAKLVEREADILGELPGIAHAQQTPPSAETPAGTRGGVGNRAASGSPRATPARASPLWPAIGYDPVTEDTLQQRSGLLPAILQAELLTLELAGHVRRGLDGRVSRARRPHRT